MPKHFKKDLYRLTYRVDGKVCFAEMLAKGERLGSLYVPSKEAHIFDGWAELSERMPASDLVIDGSFRPMTFRLTFKVGDETVEERELAYGARIENVPALADRDGYAFSGWESLPETMPAEDLVVSGRYLRDLYRLTYVVGGKHRFTVQLPYGARIEPLDAPVKDEHVFTGWENLPETMPADDIVVSGTFEMKTFRLTRIVDGEVFMAEDLPIGAKIDKKVKPVKPGYYFSGWRKLPDTMPDHDITAITSMYPVRYRVDYEIDGELWRTTYVPYTSEFVPEMPEEREGYAFGWSDAPAVMPMQDIVVHGSYVESEAEAPAEAEPAASYGLRFMLDGELLAEMTLAEGDAILAPEAPARVGYTFSGWGSLPETMPASDLTVEGGYTASLYRIVFTVDGETVSEEMLPFGAAITVPEAESRIGARFLGFGDVAATMPAADLSYEGSYAAIDYRLCFMLDGEELAVLSLPCGAEISAPEAPARVGYTFSGWESLPETMPASDLTVEGGYTQILYTLTFAVDGETVTTAQHAAGDAIFAPEAPAREGMSFVWADVPATMPASDLTVEGAYTALPVPEPAVEEPACYRLTFVAEGETLAVSEMPAGISPIVPAVPEREGYSFAWSNLPELTPAADLTVEGAYTPNAYSLTFAVDGEPISTEEMIFGAQISAPAAPHRLGFTFSGFGAIPETMPARDLVCHATFTRNSYRFTVIAGGRTLTDTSLAYGAAIELPEAPVREGYTFDGFGEVPAAMPAHDLAIAAGYTPSTYRLSFVLDGVVLSDTEVSYGSPLLAPLTEIGEGRAFDGWGSLPETMPAEDLVIRGETRAVLYHVSYLLNGETVLEADVPYGEQLPSPAVESEEGYTLSGWDIPETMPAEDLVLSATKERNLYRLTVMLDGEILSEDEVAYGSELAVPEAPERSGYIFSGWGSLPETMPAADLTVEGSFEPAVAETPAEETATVRFLHNGETLAEFTCVCGQPVTPPALPAPYRWANLPDVMPTRDTTVVSTLTVGPEFTARFYVDATLYAEVSAPEGYPVALPDAPVREGYTFSGWSNFSERMPAYDYDALAGFTPNRHSISYVVMGEVLATETALYGERLTPPAAPERFDGEFIEWIDLPETMPDEDLVIEARYSTAEYHVTYRIDGEVFYEADVAVGRMLPRLNPPTRHGMTFEGWHNFSRVMPAYPITITGKYVPTVRTVTYLSGDTVLAEREYRVGDAVVSIDGRNPLLGEFEGWFGLPAIMPDEDVVAVASYKARTYTVTYLLDGKPVATQALAAGEVIKPPVAPARENAHFREWEGLPEVMPEEDLIVCAAYDRTVFTVTYRVYGEVISTETYPVGARVRPIAAPIRAGERFVAWRNFTDKMPAYDFTVEAVYTPNLCKYSFEIDGEVLLSGEVRAGDTILAPIPEERAGLDFAGFEGYDGIMPPNDVVYVGKYVPKIYYVYYIFDGKVVREPGYTEGETVDIVPTAAELPIKAGYEFSGWSAIPTVMPNHDVDVIGTSVPLSFDLTVKADGRVISQRSIPTDSPIAHITAPRRHGYTFKGWEGLPDFMPPYDITVNGSYEASKPEYEFYTLPGQSVMSDACEADYVPERNVPRRKQKKRGNFSNVVYFSGDRVEMVSDGRSYTVDISDYVCDAEITDRDGLREALKPLGAAASSRVDYYHLVIDVRTSVDGIYEFATTDKETVRGMLEDRLFDEIEDGVTSPELLCNYLSTDEKLGTVQVAASAVDADFFTAVQEILRDCGLPVGRPVTPQMSMICFMQSKRFHAKRGALVEILTGGYVMLGLYVDRKLVCSFKNTVPFDLGYADLESEIREGLDRIYSYIEEEDVPVKISHIYYGGFRVDRLKHLVQITRKLTRSANRSARRGIAACFTVSKPGDYEVAYPFVKRRKKVITPVDLTKKP